MKVDLIRKYRWGIVAIISIIIMISVSLSFCLWDDNSLKSLKASGSSGDYKTPAYKLVDDKGKSRTTTVGDIVTFGKYYQGTVADSDVDKSPLRWIVADIRDNAGNEELYLLAESVVAFGNFDYRYYYNGNGIDTAGVWEGETKYNQRYNDSTIRAWLNSENRTDGGVGFTANDSKKVFNGFYREAFDSAEQNAIIPRNLGAMTGYSDKNNNNGTKFQYAPLNNQKVWVPSWTEVYGTTDNPWEGDPWYYGKVLDSTSDKQFTYFNSVTGYGGDTKKVGKTTQFASTAPLSNYTTKAAIHQANSQGAPWNYPPYDVTAGSVTPAWWWLRSPIPGNKYNALMVHTGGSGNSVNTFYSNGGVRPAVCLPL